MERQQQVFNVRQMDCSEEFNVRGKAGKIFEGKK